MLRLFLAYPIPDKSAFTLRALATKNSIIRGIRWTPRENMHITLFFIGEVEESNLTIIQEKLKELFSEQKSFRIIFDSIVTSGKKKKPSMIWARYFQNAEFKDLGEKIFDAVKPYMTIKTQHEDPVPHITLARIQHIADLSTLNLNTGEIPELPDVEFAELWKSVQLPAGVRYEKIEHYEFRNVL